MPCSNQRDHAYTWIKENPVIEVNATNRKSANSSMPHSPLEVKSFQQPVIHLKYNTETSQLSGYQVNYNSTNSHRAKESFINYSQEHHTLVHNYYFKQTRDTFIDSENQLTVITAQSMFLTTSSVWISTNPFHQPFVPELSLGCSQ